MKFDAPENITVAESAGFCFGVDNAVKKAYELTSEKKDQDMYMFGRLIHNKTVIDEILERGMRLAETTEDIDPSSLVLIRAHGISPKMRKDIQDTGATIVDCTCPYVTKIHEIVKKACEDKKQIIIAGSKNHPEVKGINGECGDRAIIIEEPDDVKLSEIEEKETILVAQTTYSAKKFKLICDILNKKIAKLEIFDTICSTTEKRQQEAYELSARSDVMIVIGDRESSNTKKLYEICLSNCRKTYMVEKAFDLEKYLGNNISRDTSIGIVAGASTPERNIGEVINKMSEKMTQDNQQENDNFNFQEYVDNIPQLHRGATVTGKIIRYDDEYIYVDVKDKSEGRVPIRDFTSDPEFDLEKAVAEHKEIDVYVRSIKNSEQAKEILLSKARGDNSKGRELTETAFENQEPITVKVTNIVRDGVIATYEGVDIYIHRTQLEMYPVENLEPYREKTLEILVTQYDDERRRLRVSGSRRTLLSKEREANAEKIWDEIERDKIYMGVVRSIVDFGAFVDIGGVDGLVHISELSWKRIRHPSEVVSVGDEIEVYIKDFDREKSRISLGYKNPENDPYKNLEEKFPVGAIIKGKVVRMVDFGAFIEIAPNVDALCHVTQISDGRLEKPSDVLYEGMEVDVKVMTVSSATKRISVSIKEVMPINPQPRSETAEEEEPVAEEVKAEEPVEEPVAEEVKAEEPAEEPVEEDPKPEELEEEQLKEE